MRASGDDLTGEAAARTRLRAVFRWWTLAIVCAGVAVLIPVYWIALHSPAAGMFHDDGVYLVTAKALATGHGYRIISLPGEIPQTKYPILFPFVLSLVWRVAPGFPANLLALKLAPMAFALIWFWLAYRLIARESSRAAAAICVLMTAMLLWTIYLGTALLSETLFAALCTGCLYLLRGAERDEDDRWQWFAAAALAGLACLTRTAGVSLIAAGFVYFVARRRFGRAAAYAAIALAVCGPWFLWSLTQHLPATDAYYSAANYGSWNVLSRSFPMNRKVVVVALNAFTLLRLPLSLTGLRLNGWVEFGMCAAMLAAGVKWLRGRTVLDLFLGIYVAMTLAWAWPPERFVVVVYPILLLLGWRVWRVLAKRFGRWSIAIDLAGMAFISVVAAETLWSAWAGARLTQSTGIVLGQQDAWRDTSQQVNWIRQNTPPDAILLANLDPLFYLYTGRKAVRGYEADPYALFYTTESGLHPLGTLADLRAEIRSQRVTYIIRAANQTFSEGPYLDRLILELIRSEPGALRLVSQGADPRFQIYHVERPL